MVNIVAALVAAWRPPQMLYRVTYGAWFVACWVCYFVGTSVFATKMVLRWLFEMLSATTFVRLAVGC